MSPLSSRGSPPTPPGRKILEVFEGPLLNGNLPRASVRNGFAPLTAGDAFFTSAVGAPTYVDVGNGVRAWRMVSAVNTLTGRLASYFDYRLNRNPLLAPLLPALGEPLLRSTFECVAWRDVLTAGVLYSVGVRSQVPHVSYAGGGSSMGFELCSNPAVNAGRWTVRHRLLAGGAVVTATDTGVVPTANPARMRFQFATFPAPAFTIELNGVLVFTAAGAANLPSAALGASELYGPAFCSGDNPGSAVGATDWLAAARYTLEEL